MRSLTIDAAFSMFALIAGLAMSALLIALSMTPAETIMHQINLMLYALCGVIIGVAALLYHAVSSVYREVTRARIALEKLASEAEGVINGTLKS